ncbi:hypothetical protein GCM10017779_17290 [Streptomyces capillispiralis]|nr:hypothetical protein GCM10017779_17290 [Streptomyces capillispiralis]
MATERNFLNAAAGSLTVHPGARLPHICAPTVALTPRAPKEKKRAKAAAADRNTVRFPPRRPVRHDLSFPVW